MGLFCHAARRAEEEQCTDETMSADHSNAKGAGCAARARSSVLIYSHLRAVGGESCHFGGGWVTVKIDLAYGQYRPPGGSHPAQP